MSQYNQTELVTLDGTEYLLILKEGVLYRIALETILDYGVLNNIVEAGTVPP